MVQWNKKKNIPNLKMFVSTICYWEFVANFSLLIMKWPVILAVSLYRWSVLQSAAQR
jgi:hypothetical protein